jgi:hypothetical protein
LKILDSFNGGHEGGVNFLLDGFELGADCAFWDFTCVEELGFIIFGSFCAFKELRLVVEGGCSGNSTGSINLGAGSNDVRLVNTAAWASVDFVRSSDKKKARWKLLQEDYTFTTVTTSEEDEDGTLCDGGTKFGSAWCEVTDTGNFLVIGRVETGVEALRSYLLDLSFVCLRHDDMIILLMFL